MGWGDFGSNGSVHWRIHDHDNVSEPPLSQAADGNKRHPRSPDGTGIAPKAALQGPTATGSDTGTSRPIIGNGKAGDGKFRVTGQYGSAFRAVEEAVRAVARLYQDPAQAEAAITRALAESNAQNANALISNRVVLDVDVWGDLRDEARAFEPAEIRVDW